jgi:hypothetical protein
MPFRRIVQDPPSGITGTLREYLTEISRAINDRPVMSYFSGTSPNSVVSGYAGDIAINLGSASTSTRVWVLSGAPSTVTNQGWVRMAILT